MAYGGGIFVPSETAYKDPNRFRDVLQAEGNKEAQYLAQMDQFYAELDEMKREFDVTTEQKDRFFEEELAFKREELDWKSEQNALDRSLSRWTVGQQVGVQREQLAQGQRQWEAEFGETTRNNEFFRSIYSNRETRTQGAYDAYYDMFRSAQSPQLGTPSPPDYLASGEKMATPLDPYAAGGISGTSYSGFNESDYAFDYNNYNPADWEDTLW